MSTHRNHKKPHSSEAGIVGDWIFENNKMRSDDNTLRIEWLVNNYLVKTGTEDGGWTTNYQDPEDGRYWQHSYPKSYMHGGGPPMLEQITPVTIAYKQIKDALSVPLKAKLYDDVIEERYDFETFGSRYIVWSNNQRAIRLIWDGRDSQFVLEAANSLPLTTYTEWEEIIRCYYNQQLDNLSQLSNIATNMSDSLHLL